jgi:zinc protease
MRFEKSLQQVLARTAAVVALAGALAATGWCQGAPETEKSEPLSKIVRLNRAPVSKDVLQVKLPKPVEATLPNGVSVLILEDHRFPTVTVEFEIDGAGPLFESAGQPGLAGAAAQLLRQGTKTRSSRQIAEQVDSLGATLMANAPFGSDTTVVTASGPSENFAQWFALTANVLLHPSFPADELAQYKDRAKPGLLQQRTQPNFLANQTFSRALYGTFPAAVVSATPESIDALTPATLADWHNKRYTPQNTLLAISGDVRPATLLPQLRQWLAEWQRTESSVNLPAGPRPAAKGRVYLVDRPGSVQTTLLMGNLAIARNDPDYPALVVLNEVLGAGAASRLFLNLREEKGYTYGVYSSVRAQKYAGPWTAGGDLRTEVTDGAMTQFLYELNRIRDEKVPDAELDSARRAVVARFALSLESPQQLIAYATTRKRYNFPADYWDKYPAQVAAVTADAVQRVAQKYIDPATMQVVAVGDASKIKAVMEKYGPVETVDPSAKPAAEGSVSRGANLR